MNNPAEMAKAFTYYIVVILYSPLKAPVSAIGITLALFNSLAKGKLTNLSEYPLQNFEQKIRVPTIMSPMVSCESTDASDSLDELPLELPELNASITIATITLIRHSIPLTAVTDRLRSLSEMSNS